MDWLLEQYRRIEEQKLRQERHLSNIRTLLKPWPQSDVEPAARNMDAQSKSGCDLKAGEPPELTAEEQHHLRLVDKLLSKAQKARDVQNKLAEPKRPKVKDALLKPDSAEPRQHKPAALLPCVASDNKVDIREKNDRPEANSVKTSGSKKINGLLNKAVSNTRAQSETNDAKSRTSKVLEKSEKEIISQRPKSSSVQKKVVPAHVSAPFQTNPRLSTNKLQTTYRAATAKTFSKVKVTRNSAVISKRGTSGSAGKTNTVEHESLCSEKSDFVQHDVIYQESENVDYVTCKEDCTYEKTSPRIYDGKLVCDGVDMVQGGLQKVMIADQANCLHENSRADTEHGKAAQPFNLTKDGTTLSVPGRLKKLLYQNRKLREKLYTQNVTLKVDSPNSSSDLPPRLNHAFGDEDTQLAQLQARQARHILHTYTSLSELLESLHLEQISADSSPEDVYHAKRMMEYILLTFQEMEDKLHTSDFKALNRADLYTGPVRPQLPVPELSHPAVWYNKQAVTGSLPAAAVYKYKTYKELETYMNSLYQVQLLQLQSDVMDTVSRLLLPLLQSLNPGSSEFAQVLRIGYSLMSINPNKMPVVVKDTIQDQSILDTEEEQQP